MSKSTAGDSSACTLESTSRTAERPVGDLADERPSIAALLAGLGIDTCCRGRRSLAQAAEEAGLCTETLARSVDALLKAKASRSMQPTLAPRDLPLPALADHIVAAHHSFVRRTMPRLKELAGRVVAAHGGDLAFAREAETIVCALDAEMASHMLKEEMVLFPAIRLLAGSEAPPVFPFGTLANPIRCMEAEHDSAGSGLHRLAEITDGYAAPEGACPTLREYLETLAELDADMRTHVHLENNVLFPRALERERLLAHERIAPSSSPCSGLCGGH